jgi:SAM-dependent methyltransferase
VDHAISREFRQLVEDLRLLAYDGEPGFFLICEFYWRLVLKSKPLAPLLTRAQLAPLSRHPRLEAALKEAILRDPSGANLPRWYQHFIGRKYRGATGKFFTPVPVAAAMAALFPIPAQATLLDPACGAGTFLSAVKSQNTSTPAKYVYNDIEPALIELARLGSALNGMQEEETDFYCENIFDPSTRLHATYKDKVDIILANPPFSVYLTDVTFFSPIFSAGYHNSDAIFLDACLHFLKPGGKMALLLPHSLVANANFRKFRIIVEKNWGLLGVIALPEGVFKLTAEATTRTDIVLLEKRTGPVGKRIFGYVQTVGVRTTGRSSETISNDLDSLVRSNPLGIGL